VTAAIADVAEGNGEIVAGLPLEVQIPVYGVGQDVVLVVCAEVEGVRAVGIVVLIVGSAAVLSRLGVSRTGVTIFCGGTDTEHGLERGRDGRRVGVGGNEGGGSEWSCQGGRAGSSYIADEGRRLGNAEGAAIGAARGLGQVAEELATVVVDAESAIDHKLAVVAFGRPGEAYPRGDAPLAAIERGVRGAFAGIVVIVAGDDEPGICNRESGGYGAGDVVEGGLEVEDIAVFLCEAAVVVVPDSRGEGEIGEGLPLVLDVARDFVGAIVAVGQVVTVRYGLEDVRALDGSGEEGFEGLGLDFGVSGAVVLDVELGVAVSAAGDDGVLA
jgi:hypothetical protein